MHGRLFSDRDLWRLIIPLAIEQVLLCTVGAVDTMMVSSLGEECVSGVSLVDMVNNFIIHIFSAIATGGAVVASQYLGAKQEQTARDSAKQLIKTTAAVAIVCMIITETFQRFIIRGLFGELSDGVMASSMTYFRITALSFPIIAVHASCSALFRSMNKTNITLLSSLISNIVNVAGNALLIYVVKWGVAGAAIATVFARFCAMVMLLKLLTNKNNTIYITLRNWGHANWILVRKILAIGIPSGIENGVFQFGRLVVVGIIAGFGTTQIAANAVANNIDYFGCVVGSAFSLASITVIGQAVGFGDEEQIRYYVNKIMTMAYKAHIIWNIILFILTPFLLGFYELSEETTRLAVWLIIIHNGFGMLLWPMSFVFPNVLRAMNDVRFTMFASIGSMIVWRLGFSYILGKTLAWGALGVWTAMVIDWCCRIICFTWRYKSNRWRKYAFPKSNPQVEVTPQQKALS